MIIHVDMDAFYASVEIRDNPNLAGKPVVVGGSVKGRGVIAAASYEARKYGVFSAMSSKVALQKCPHLIFVKGRMDHYAAISRQIREIFFSFTSVVEPLALDEAFLDVSGCERLFGDGLTIAKMLKQKIFQETKLVASAGVAPNKFLAKIASDLDKPDGLTWVDPENVQGFLDPLPIAHVWGVGPATEKKLARLGVSNIAQLRGIPVDVLTDSLGVSGKHFWSLSRGIDDRPVVPDRIAKSVSHERTFPTDIFDNDVLLAWLFDLTDQVGRRLRRNNTFTKTVTLKFRFDNFETLARSRTISPSNTTQTLFDTAAELMNAIHRSPNRGVRLIGMGGTNLTKTAQVQMSLFDQSQNDKNADVDNLSDAIRDKFGASKLHRGTNIEHKIRLKPDPPSANE